MDKEEKFFNPFPGLRSFEETEDYLFFGREKQCEELLKRLEQARFLAILGVSGSGKSSLIKAGLVPALKGGFLLGTGSCWRVATFRPGGNPLGQMAKAITRLNLFANEDKGISAEICSAMIEGTLRRSRKGLIEISTQARLSEDEHLLLVVDQFEELLRFHDPDQDRQRIEEASDFVHLLLEARKSVRPSIFIVLTLRSDYLGNCARFIGLSEAINDGQYLVPRMTREQRQQAIERPIAVGRGRVAGPLVQRLLNDSGDNPDQLSVLQHSLMRTWNQWQEAGGVEMGFTHYEAIGTLDQALSQHGDEIYGTLNSSQQMIAEKVFKALTVLDRDNRGIRRPTRLETLVEIAESSAAEIGSVLDAFRTRACSFLVPPAAVALTDISVIDITHESLMRVWTRLRDWVEEEAESSRKYQRLVETLRLHQTGGGNLLRDPELQATLDWMEKTKSNPAWAAHQHIGKDGIQERVKQRNAREEFEQILPFLNESKKEWKNEIQRREEEIQRQQELEQAKAIAAEREEKIKAQETVVAERDAKLEAQQKAARNQMRIFYVVLAGLFVVCLLGIWAMGERGRAKKTLLVAERERESAIQAKSDAEEQRKRADNEKDMAIAEKEIAQIERQRAEVARMEAEKAKRSAEEARTKEAEQRQKAEKARIEADDAKQLAEQARAKEREQRKEAEVALERAEVAEEEARRELAEKQKALDTLMALTEKQGRLYLSGLPTNARIHIAGVDEPYLDGMKLDAGTYELTIAAVGFEKKVQPITIKAGIENKIPVKKMMSLPEAFKRMDFVPIQPDTFIMGSPLKEAGRYDDEQRHKISFTKEFSMQSTEVTVGQWRTFFQATGIKSDAETQGGAYVWNGSTWNARPGSYWDNPGFGQTDEHPVTCVSWNDTQAFILWLSAKTGLLYRLPSEAEWEYACRAGTSTAYSFGESSRQLAIHGNYCDRNCPADWKDKKHRDGFSYTAPVGQLKPNAWGLYDMHGNVWEWCQDWYSASYYYKSLESHPRRLADGSSRVFRGGSWDVHAKFCRSAARGRRPPNAGNTSSGFRLVLLPGQL